MAKATELSLRVGTRIRQRRKELRLTQKQLAHAMIQAAATIDEPSAADPQRVSDWERGYNVPSERYLRQLVLALKVPDASYFYEAPERPDLLDELAPPPAEDRLDRIEGTLNGLIERLVADKVIRAVAKDTGTTQRAPRAKHRKPAA